jgi:hypothetical protein
MHDHGRVHRASITDTDGRVEYSEGSIRKRNSVMPWNGRPAIIRRRIQVKRSASAVRNPVATWTRLRVSFPRYDPITIADIVLNCGSPMLGRLLAASCLLLAPRPMPAQEPVLRLQDVHKLYVESFGSGEAAEVIRSKVIAQLVKSGRFEAVQSQDQADATLVGSSQVTSAERSGTNVIGGTVIANSGTVFHATAGVRLVTKNQKILWADDASGRGSSARASSSLADRIVKDLLKDLSKKEKSR